MNAIARLSAVLAALGAAAFLPGAAPAQIRPPLLEVVLGVPACESGPAVAERLLAAHPLGGATGPLSRCDGVGAAWTPTRALGGEERRVWDRALARLSEVDEGCRMAASEAARLERAGRVSVWEQPDTVGGLVYFGATYVSTDGRPLAMQFWAPTFDRPLAWVAGAVAHEGFHALEPAASEDEALRFGDRCARAVERVARPRVVAVGTAGWVERAFP